MPELRQDPVTKKWVIIATERSKRPSDYFTQPVAKKGGNCPFCEGNEAQTPPEITSYRNPGTHPDQPGWWIRVVPNKFAALNHDGMASVEQGSFYRTRPGTGVHEVIIESTEHNATMAQYEQHQIEEIFRAWRERQNTLMQEPKIEYVQIFENVGGIAGASLEHPHSQVIATPLIPPVVFDELRGAEYFGQANGNCPYCEIIAQEIQDGRRKVAENDDFIAFCPFASRFPFETWIVPRQHMAGFNLMYDGNLPNLSRIVKETLMKLSGALQSPPYNMVLHTAPVGYTEVPYYHWHLEILPRLTIVAGFEWGSGVYINPTPPEAAAGYLIATKI